MDSDVGSAGLDLVPSGDSLADRIADVGSDECVLVFSTYQSAWHVREAGVKWGMRVLDEAHRAVALVRDSKSKAGSFLDALDVDCDVHLSMTATPRVNANEEEAYLKMVADIPLGPVQAGHTMAQDAGQESRDSRGDETLDATDDEEDNDRLFDQAVYRDLEPMSSEQGPLEEQIIAALAKLQDTVGTLREGSLAKVRVELEKAKDGDDLLGRLRRLLSDESGVLVDVCELGDEDDWRVSVNSDAADLLVAVTGPAFEEGMWRGRVLVEAGPEGSTVSESSSRALRLVSMADVDHHGVPFYFCTWEDAVRGERITKYDLLMVQSMAEVFESANRMEQDTFVLSAKEGTQERTEEMELARRLNLRLELGLDSVVVRAGHLVAAAGILQLVQARAAKGERCRVVTFHSTIVEAVRFARMLQVLRRMYGVDEAYVNAVSSDNSLSKRKMAVATFHAADLAVLCTCKLFLEGW